MGRGRVRGCILYTVDTGGDLEEGERRMRRRRQRKRRERAKVNIITRIHHLVPRGMKVSRTASGLRGCHENCELDGAGEARRVGERRSEKPIKRASSIKLRRRYLLRSLGY